jgi:hypothetical protein
MPPQLFTPVHVPRRLIDDDPNVFELDPGLADAAQNAIADGTVIADEPG